MYALVLDGQIDSVGPAPAAARRLDTGEWVCPPDGNWTDPDLATCGYLPVTTTPRPADTATTTYDYAVDLVNGVPTETWTERPKTTAETQADTSNTNRTSLQTKAANALATNATFLGLASPTNAQVVAQVAALTRQVNALIRLAINQLDSTSGT